MAAALGGVIVWPLDRLLEPFERRRYRRAPRPSRPLVLVCGAPRSGTTIVALTLIRYLPVGYFPNLTSLFPRSPLTALALFGGVLSPERRPLENYYGRTAGLGGPNDALYLWDRWLGDDRMTVPSLLSPEQVAAMRRFVGATEAFFGRPLVAKNNALHASAHLVAEALPEARFVYLEREPLALAQSLLRARLEIHGTDTIAYGLTARRPVMPPPTGSWKASPDRSSSTSASPRRNGSAWARTDSGPSAMRSSASRWRRWCGNWVRRCSGSTRRR